MKYVCVFCGSSPSNRPAYREAAAELGGLIARRGLRLVYGGARIGLMGALADAALAAGGAVTGVIPRGLVEKEIAHTGLGELCVVASMHERKARMAELADAFVALPGGFGTLEEFCEMLTWTQLGLHAKPCGLLNVEGFYDALLALFDRAAADRLLHPQQRASVIACAAAGELLDRLAASRPATVEKWLDRQAT